MQLQYQRSEDGTYTYVSSKTMASDTGVIQQFGNDLKSQSRSSAKKSSELRYYDQRTIDEIKKATSNYKLHHGGNSIRSTRSMVRGDISTQSTTSTIGSLNPLNRRHLAIEKQYIGKRVPKDTKRSDTYSSGYISARDPVAMRDVLLLRKDFQDDVNSFLKNRKSLQNDFQDDVNSFLKNRKSNISSGESDESGTTDNFIPHFQAKKNVPFLRFPRNIGQETGRTNSRSEKGTYKIDVKKEIIDAASIGLMDSSLTTDNDSLSRYDRYKVQTSSVNTAPRSAPVTPPDDKKMVIEGFPKINEGKSESFLASMKTAIDDMKKAKMDREQKNNATMASLIGDGADSLRTDDRYKVPKASSNKTVPSTPSAKEESAHNAEEKKVSITNVPEVVQIKKDDSETFLETMKVAIDNMMKAKVEREQENISMDKFLEVVKLAVADVKEKNVSIDAFTVPGTSTSTRDHTATEEKKDDFMDPITMAMEELYIAKEETSAAATRMCETASASIEQASVSCCNGSRKFGEQIQVLVIATKENFIVFCDTVDTMLEKVGCYDNVDDMLEPFDKKVESIFQEQGI